MALSHVKADILTCSVPLKMTRRGWDFQYSARLEPKSPYSLWLALTTKLWVCIDLQEIKMVYESSLGDGWETTHCLPQFLHLQQTSKNSNSLSRDFKADKSLFGDFWADKTFTTCLSGCRVQVWVQVWAPTGYLAITPKGNSLGVE